MKTSFDYLTIRKTVYLFYEGKYPGELATAGSFSQHLKLFAV